MENQSWFREHVFFLAALIALIGTGIISIRAMQNYNSESEFADAAETLLATIKPDNQVSSFVPGEILVKFKENVLAQKQSALLKQWQLAEKYEIKPLKVKVFTVPEGAEDVLVQALGNNPNIAFAERNGLLRSGVMPNDPQYPSEWHLPKISAPGAWDIGTGSTNVVIAIVDSGVDPIHPDLQQKLVPGWNFLSGNTDTHDVLGHGTAVAGTAAAVTNNANGISAIGWNNKIMPLVVLNANDYATWTDVANATIYATDHGANVINISIGGSSNSTTLQNAMTYAWNHGVVVVASAMNNNTNVPYYPAAATNVLAVAATDQNDAKASFSNFGDWIDVAAPGVNILTTNNGSTYGYWYGTSFSAPMTSGVIALMRSVNSALSNSQIVTLLEQNTDDLGAAGFDTTFGWGRINAQKALTAARNAISTADTTSPTTAISSPANGATVSATIAVSATASDNVGVTKVELWKDGTLFGTAVGLPYDFSWNTINDTDGSHTLQTKAFDAAGNIGLSNSITIKVANTPDTIAPVVTVTSPLDGAKLPKRGNVTLSATASDNNAISQIDILFDTVLRTSCFAVTSCAYTLNTRNVTGGSHTVTARAFDMMGNSASNSVFVTK